MTYDMCLIHQLSENQIQSTARKYRLGHAVDHSVHSIESCFSCPPLLHHSYQPVCEFQNHGMNVPSEKDIALSFKDILDEDLVYSHDAV